MKARYIITAVSAAVLLAGCGKVDAPIEKKSVVFSEKGARFFDRVRLP